MVISLWFTEQLLEEVTRSSSKHYCFFESMAPFVHCLKYFYKCSTALKKVFSDTFHILDQSMWISPFGCFLVWSKSTTSFCRWGVWLHSQHLFWFSPLPPRWLSSSVLCVLLQHHWNIKIWLFDCCLLGIHFVWCRQGSPSSHPTPHLAMSHLHLTEVPVESYFQLKFETIFTSFCLCMLFILHR